MLIKLIKYLLTLINAVINDGISSNKNKNIKKSRNKLVKILAKSKS